MLTDRPADGVLRLTISNPARRNALDHAILDGLARTLPELDHRCVIVTGEPGIFSAGYDIADLPDEVFAEEAERLVAHPFAAALGALDACPVPTLAALPGHTIGGGLELALACDLRLGADGIRLGMPPAKLGLVYSHTGLRRFLQTIGVPRTRELFLLGRNVDARTGAAWRSRCPATCAWPPRASGSACRPPSSGSSTPTRASRSSSRWSARRARASCSWLAGGSTPTRRSRGDW